MPAINPDEDPWVVPEELYELMADKSLKQRDRVELVTAFYAEAHGGNSPTFEKIGRIMGINRGNVYRFAMELCHPKRRRAVNVAGKFWLVNSQYSHPLIKERFSEYTVEPNTDEKSNQKVKQKVYNE